MVPVKGTDLRASFFPPSYLVSSPHYLIPFGKDIFSTAALQDSEVLIILLTEGRWDRCSFGADLAGRVSG